MMTNRIALSVALALFVGSPLLSGCDETTAEKTTVTTGKDGSMKKDSVKETVSPDGTVTKTEEQTVIPAKKPDVTETKTTVTDDGKTVTKTEEKSVNK